MSEAIWVAVIGAVATVAAAIIMTCRSRTPGAPSPPELPAVEPKRPVVALPDAPQAEQPRPSDEGGQGDGESAGRGRREETLSVLFRHRVVAQGTEIEPMPQALPADNSGSGPDTFRVRIGRPPGREVVWAVDNKPYSLTALSNKLSEEHGLVWFWGRTFELWRLVGGDESLWDMAERLVHQEAAQRG